MHSIRHKNPEGSGADVFCPGKAPSASPGLRLSCATAGKCRVLPVLRSQSPQAPWTPLPFPPYAHVLAVLVLDPHTDCRADRWLALASPH